MSGLLQNAICISGAAAGTLGSTSLYLQSAVAVADVLNCTGIATTADLVACLRRFDGDTLDRAVLIASVLANGTAVAFKPVVDGDLVPFPPTESFRLGYGWRSFAFELLNSIVNK